MININKYFCNKFLFALCKASSVGVRYEPQRLMYQIVGLRASAPNYDLLFCQLQILLIQGFLVLNVIWV
jgi:hypothetical protein